MKFKCALPIVCLFATVTLSGAYAQDIWNGGTGNWSNAANWSTGFVPNGPTVDVRIDNGNPVVSVVTFDLVSGSVGDLILDPDDTLVINGALTSYFATLNSGDLTIQNGGTLNSNGLLNNYGGIGVGLGGLALNNYGLLNNYGGIDVFTTGTLNNASGAQFNNYGGIHIGFEGGYLGNAGLLNNYGAIDVNSDLGYFSNSGTIYNYGEIGSFGGIGNAGTIYSSGEINVGHDGFSNSGTVYSSGAINISDASSFSNGGTLYNYGMIYGHIGSQLFNSGLLNNYGQLTDGGGCCGFDNSGTLNNYAGSYLENHGTLGNSGTILVASGAVLVNASIHSPATYEQSAGSTVVDGLFTSDTPIQIDGGTLSGKGIIQGDVMMGGTLSPGDSPGRLTIQGNYTQLSTGTFFAELAGLIPGTQYDQLVVSGLATLDGTLDVVLLNGFVVKVGDSFVLMTFGSESGQFSALDLPTLSRYEQWLLSYNANDLTLSVLGTPTPEPVSFLLLGSGLLSAAFGLRRRRMS
jgi:hypothetical protein